MSNCNKKKRNIIDVSKHKDLEEEFIKKKAKRCIHGKRLFYCKECDGRRLCIHEKCKYMCCICRGSGICKHDKNKYNCRLCLQENEINKLKKKINNLQENNCSDDNLEENNCLNNNLDLLIEKLEEENKLIKSDNEIVIEKEHEIVIEKEHEITIEQDNFDFVFSSGYYKLEILREENRHKEDMERKNIELKRVELESKKLDLELLKTKLKSRNN